MGTPSAHLVDPWGGGRVAYTHIEYIYMYMHVYECVYVYVGF